MKKKIMVKDRKVEVKERMMVVEAMRIKEKRVEAMKVRVTRVIRMIVEVMSICNLL